MKVFTPCRFPLGGFLFNEEGAEMESRLLAAEGWKLGCSYAQSKLPSIKWIHTYSGDEISSINQLELVLIIYHQSNTLLLHDSYF